MLANLKQRGVSWRLRGCCLLRAWRLAFAAAGLALGAFSSAWAGPPYLVDDPGTLDYRRLFLYVAEIGALSQGTYTHSAPNFVLGYGVRPNLEISLGISGYTSNTPSIALDNYQNPAIAIKWRFREEERGWPALALAYQATLITQDQGFGRNYGVHNLYLTGSWTLGKGLLWGNAGLNILPYPNLSASVLYGVAYDYPLGNLWRVGAQLYGNTALNASGIPLELAWGVGATYVLNSYSTLLFQIGPSLAGNSDLNVYAGVLWRLSP
jgi:hypothetical protein